jgi:hypothetical protein
VSDTIDVLCAPSPGGWTCRVSLDVSGSRSTHEVTVSEPVLARLAPGSPAPDDLVRRSFRFLLAREPAASILPRFDLPVIGRYFPEYEREIRTTGSAPRH